MGRPTRLTKERHEKIEKAVRGGATLEAAANYGGVTYQTFRNWMRRGEDYTEPKKPRGKAKAPPDTEEKFLEFFEAIKKAEADCEVVQVAIILKAAPVSWQAAAWWLERRRPEHYGRANIIRQPKGESLRIDQQVESKIEAEITFSREELSALGASTLAGILADMED